MTKRVFALASGSGGVGKSTLALALALSAAAAGKQTVLLDASGAARSCDLMLGLESAVAIDLTDVLGGQAELKSALYRAPQQENLRFCCTSLLGDAPIDEFAGAVLALRSMCDVLVIDLPTGELALGGGLLGEEDARVILARPDDASLRAAERMLMLAGHERAQSFVVLSRVRKELIKKGRQYSEEAAAQILGVPIAGSIPEDDALAWRIGKERTRLWLTGTAQAKLDQAVHALLNR